VTTCFGTGGESVTLLPKWAVTR